MANHNERMAVASVYSGKGWKDKVNKMGDAQVTALYLKFKADGKIK